MPRHTDVTRRGYTLRMRRISRRLFLATSSAAAALPLIRTVRLEAQVEPVFRHGVASGDPLTDRVMLWTRVSVPAATASVTWVMARDPKFARIVARGEQQTGDQPRLHGEGGRRRPRAGHDLLLPLRGGEGAVGDRPHPHAARARRRAHPPGRGVVLELSVRLLQRLCRAGASATDLDAVLHLGDYIYEYANGGFGDGSAIGRIPEPNHEILALADYRARHAQHRRIPTRRPSTASIRSSSSGTITSSPTTRGPAAPRTTIPRKAKATGSRGGTRPSRPTSSGCRSARTVRRSARSSTAR